MINLKSTQEQLKPIKDKLLSYSTRVSYTNSRNLSNNKNNKTSFNEILYPNTSNESKRKKKKLKNKNSNKSKMILKTKKIIYNNLKKYNVNNKFYNIKVINDIIYDEPKHIVSVFKNYLLWDEINDFLKRFYYKKESIKRLPQITNYYEKYTLFSPVYFSLDDLVKIMNKNVKKKKNILKKLKKQKILIIIKKKR
jgi:hypothetical protein